MAKKVQARISGTKTQERKTKKCPRCSGIMEWAKIEMKSMKWFCTKCGCILAKGEE